MDGTHVVTSCDSETSDKVIYNRPDGGVKVEFGSEKTINGQSRGNGQCKERDPSVISQ